MLSDGIPAGNAVTKKPRVVLVKRQLRKRHIESDLKSRGVCPASGDWTAYALRRMQIGPVNKYEAFLNFVGVLNIYARNKYTVDQSRKIPIRVPWHTDLNGINYGSLLKRDGAMREIKRRCVMPEGKFEIDLRRLIWYYHTFID